MMAFAVLDGHYISHAEAAAGHTPELESAFGIFVNVEKIITMIPTNGNIEFETEIELPNGVLYSPLTYEEIQDAITEVTTDAMQNAIGFFYECHAPLPVEIYDSTHEE